MTRPTTGQKMENPPVGPGVAEARQHAAPSLRRLLGLSDRATDAAVAETAYHAIVTLRRQQGPELGSGGKITATGARAS